MIRLSKLVIIPSLLFLGACSPMNDNSLLTDKSSDSSSYSLNKEPRSDELYLRPYNSTVNVAASVTQAQVSGECYTSTYPRHQIVALNNAGGQMDIVDINTASAVNSLAAACKNGKFNLAINTGVLTSGAVHSIKLLLIAYNDKNQTITNEAQGSARLTLTK